MICQQFKNMSQEDQDMLIAKLNHAVRNEDVYCKMAQIIVKRAEEGGTFDNIKFGEEIFADEQR